MNDTTAFTVVIPARYASSRLPGKPLLDIAGQTMIQRVYAQCVKSSASQVVIATDDQRVESAVQGFGAKLCMTRSDHQSGTDRIQEVVTQLGLQDDDIVVNVQGDEPLIPPSLINQVASNLARYRYAQIATLAEPLSDYKTLFDPNAVKVVFDQDGRALYFSRAPIPWSREEFPAAFASLPSVEPEEIPLRAGAFFKHIGIYAYRVSFLHQFVQWAPSSLEQLEALEQLRALQHGVAIHVEAADQTPAPGVDTPADLEKVRAFFLESNN